MLRAFTFSLVLLLSSLAHAQSDDDVEAARARFDEGTVHYQEGRFLEAAAAYEDAYRMSPRPVILRNAAIAYERALELERAADALERYLAAADMPDDEPEVRTRIARLLELTASPEPAEPETAPVEVPVEVEVWPLTPPTAAPEPAPEPEADPAAVAEPVEEPPAQPPGPDATMGSLGLTLGGLALIATAVAIGYGAEALERAATVNETCPDRLCPFALDSGIFGDAREAADYANGFGIVALGLGALATLFTVLAIAELSGDAEAARAFVTPDGVGVRW